MMMIIMIINALAKVRAFTGKQLQQEASGTDLLQTEAQASAPLALQLQQQSQP